MHFTYCPHCGKKLTDREIGDEGMIPFCADCDRPFWDMFTTCVICAVVNEYNEVTLIEQSYDTQKRYVCVAGIMQMGESAEETVVREIKEEIGLDAESVEFVKSYFYNEKAMLMLGFCVRVKKSDYVLSGEVSKAQWISLQEAPKKLREGSIAWQLVSEVAGRVE